MKEKKKVIVRKNKAKTAIRPFSIDVDVLGMMRSISSEKMPSWSYFVSECCRKKCDEIIGKELKNETDI